MTTIYTHRSKIGIAVTDEREAFLSYLMENAPDAARELRELGVSRTLARCESAERQLWELIGNVADGCYENDSQRDLTLHGLADLEEDFLELGRDPGDDFCGITISERKDDVGDIVKGLITDIIAEMDEQDAGDDDDDDYDDHEKEDDDDKLRDILDRIYEEYKARR